MGPKRGGGDPVAGTLSAILLVLQDLLILECARTGMKRDELRRVVPVDKTRISRIMKHAKKAKGDRGNAP